MPPYKAIQNKGNPARFQGSFTQLYWRLCINTHAHLNCKPEWTQVQSNLDTKIIPIFQSQNHVIMQRRGWLQFLLLYMYFCFFFFTKKSSKATESSFILKKFSLPDKTWQSRVCLSFSVCLCVSVWLWSHSPSPEPSTTQYCQVESLNIASVYY